ncbi:MAG: tRNA 2-thiouridine(34) synthase MnmA [Chloroflexi bacterium]|nr:tRNA 2-thiouridine(34) synthase MnmA [Chloroflexota bacterium]MBU1747022.1 tRNA 2-thiouridine(34) synthase MnmA [Chloroflexota bacterium]
MIETLNGRPVGAAPVVRNRIAVALSGGVDSSVVAALLVEAGHEVIGVMMRLWASYGADAAANRCCTPEAVEVSSQVCAMLNIPFHVVDFQEPFRRAVVEPFCAEYAAGRTPNPCVVCNRTIKFDALLRWAFDAGADHLATGHYARVTWDGEHYHLWRGVDKAKDQSYMLHRLGQRELPHVIFPLGEWTKPQVREMARQRGLPAADRPESQEICFVPGRDYRDFLREQTPDAFRPGPIVHLDGRVLGQHAGLPAYTVGQRGGLGIAWAHPLYVVRLDPARNALVVGPDAALWQREVWVSDVSYVAGEPLLGPVRVTAKVRYLAPAAPARLEPLTDAEARLTFDEPQRAITPGQAAVFYDGDEVLGGGIITVHKE